MEDSIAKDLMQAVKSGLHDAVKSALARSYNNPVEKVLAEIVGKETPELKQLLVDATTGAIADPLFRQEIRDALRKKLASVLVQRFGVELEKQVNTLKSDPATRARLTLAIEEIVKDSVK